VHVTSKLTFEQTPPPNRVNFRQGGERGTIWSSGIIDRDGSLGGKAGIFGVGCVLAVLVCVCADDGRC
jgi:hypothetical protein